MRSGWSLRKRIRRSRSQTWFDPVPPNGPLPLGGYDTVLGPDTSAGWVNGEGPLSVGFWNLIVWSLAAFSEPPFTPLDPQPAATSTAAHMTRSNPVAYCCCSRLLGLICASLLRGGLARVSHRPSPPVNVPSLT